MKEAARLPAGQHQTNQSLCKQFSIYVCPKMISPMQLRTGAEHWETWLQLFWLLLNVRITSRKCLRTVIHSVQHSSTGLFGQIYCLNGLEIKDDSVWYTRQRCYVYASSLLSPQVIYAPVVMFSIQYFDPQCHVIPTANMSGRYFCPVFCHPKYIFVRHVCYT
jgi:hypothetical protein